MSQRTLFQKEFLRIAEDYEEPGEDALWIADELDRMEVSLSREQLTEIMPILSAWLRAGEGGRFLDYARQCNDCGKFYELIGRDDRSESCPSCYPR